MSGILIIGDAVAPTGFARVIRSIFEPLHEEFRLHQLATRYDGGPHDYPWKLYAAVKGTSVYGYDQIVTAYVLAPGRRRVLFTWKGRKKLFASPAQKFAKAFVREYRKANGQE